MEGKGGVGEVRRLHIIYFLSRTGRIEQPHLIRVTHLNKNGVYLRDVKRWLSDLRGKDMPDAFSWSYKRKYKNGYVWQDLLDDDLITPISDNEFVLKGSEIVSPALAYDMKEQEQMPKDNITELKPETEEPSLETNDESAMFGSERSSVTDESIQGEEDKLLNDHYDDGSKQSDKKFDASSTASLYSIFLKKDNKNKNDDHGHVEKSIGTPSSSSSGTFSPSPLGKSKSFSRASLFRNLLSCGAVDTNESAQVVRRDSYKHACSNGLICKEEKLGGSARVLGTTWNQRQHRQQQNARRSYDGGVNGLNLKKQREINAAYRPAHGPTCSQCGKSFKPEKLHKHMKSCRGMKAMARNANAAANKVPANKSTQNDSVFSYMLTN